MSNIPIFCWVATLQAPNGEHIPFAIAPDEEAANKVAKEAIESISLGLSYHASEAQIAETRRKFDAVSVRRAWLLIEQDPR